MYKKNVHDSPFVDGARADPRCVGPAFSLPLLPLACCSSCRGPVFEVLLPMHTAEIAGVLEPLTQSLHLSLHHYH